MTTVLEIQQANPLKPLLGKVAIVTGASRGIGAEIARVLADAGASVVATHQHGSKTINEVVHQIEEKGGIVHAMPSNVVNEEDCENLVNETIEKFGKIDILVNNAGITKDRSFRKMTKEDWDAVIDVNLNGIFNTTKAVYDHMLGQKFGRIINISSVVGLAGNFGQANYAATKAGILGFTKTLAIESASKGITVNAVCPGFIGTEMVAAMPEDVLAGVVARVPVGRLGEPREVAETVLFLSQQSYITGQAISVNGGLYM